MTTKRILRVFPRETSCTPRDELTWIGLPGLFIPPHDEVHISCVFTWDMDDCEDLCLQWRDYTDKPIKLGGPAYDRQPAGEHIPGLYTKPGIIFTSRGCNYACPWCLVSKREGKLQELEIKPGNIIQDNNFLQCSSRHQERVFQMLRKQRKIQFKGGLQVNLITQGFAEALRGLKIDELWLACDTQAHVPDFARACAILKQAGFSREKIRAYVLIGDDLEADEARLREVWNQGAMPFAQLYQPAERKRKEYSQEWRDLARLWSRPAAMRCHMKQQAGRQVLSG